LSIGCERKEFFMSTPLHVLVIGGGIGGLCLAQGLRQAGVSVAVYERDRTRADWLQGYRIHINPAGSKALHECLPPAVWDTFVATAGVPSAGFGFLTEQMKELVFIEEQTMGDSPDPAASHHPVSRITLRQVLLTGLDDVVHFDKAFVRYEQSPDGKVTACFADGTSATGDVLVGADGAASRVRRQYLPQAKVVDTGVVALVGKFPLTEQTRDRLPRRLTARPNTILPPKGCGMFVAEFIRKPDGAHGDISGADEAARQHPGLLFDKSTNYVFWAFVAPRDKYAVNGDPHHLSGLEIQQLALQMISAWHADFRRLVAESDPTTMAALPIQTAVPIAPWATTNVTLLGDAIHTMTPLQGIGGNTALRDASSLCHQLVDVARSRSALLPAIHEYEAAMVEYGFDAVRASLRTAQLAVSDNGFGRAIFKTILRAANVMPPLKQRIFSAMGS
jgi:salicylate hydroxylase